jgi:ribosomal protein S18 acetylase RimI-like enzyme
MQVSELAAWRACVDRIVLTVFRNNAGAAKFYKRLGYVVDESDPSMHGEQAEYEILSKQNPTLRR